MLFAPAGLIGICYSALLFGSRLESKSQEPSQADPGKQLAVRISAKKHRIRSGDSLTLTVEVRNLGSTDIFVAKNIGQYGEENGSLALYLHYGSKVEGSSEGSAADFICSRSDDSKKPPLASQLSRYWLVLPPGHFYGAEIVMDASLFDHLNIPGKYRVTGQYSSRGFLMNDEGNPLGCYVDELKQLPYQAWRGTVETNSIWMEVVGPGRQEK